MNIFIAITLAFSVVISIVLLVFWLIFNDDDNDPGIYVKFKTFKQWYNLAPDSYSCTFDWVYKRSSNMSIMRYYIKFGFISYVQYIIWLRMKIIYDRRNKCNEVYKNFLLEVQDDLEKYKSRMFK